MMFTISAETTFKQNKLEFYQYSVYDKRKEYKKNWRPDREQSPYALDWGDD